MRLSILGIIAFGVLLIFRSPDYHPVERRVITSIWVAMALAYLVFHLDPFFLWHWLFRN